MHHIQITTVNPMNELITVASQMCTYVENSTTLHEDNIPLATLLNTTFKEIMYTPNDKKKEAETKTRSKAEPVDHKK